MGQQHHQRRFEVGFRGGRTDGEKSFGAKLVLEEHRTQRRGSESAVEGSTVVQRQCAQRAQSNMAACSNVSGTRSERAYVSFGGEVRQQINKPGISWPHRPSELYHLGNIKVGYPLREIAHLSIELVGSNAETKLLTTWSRNSDDRVGCSLVVIARIRSEEPSSPPFPCSTRVVGHRMVDGISEVFWPGAESDYAFEPEEQMLVIEIARGHQTYDWTAA